MLLPTAKTPPKQSLSELTVLVYGPTKIGKSTMCSQAEEALFLATEPGLNALETYQVPITTWDSMLAVCGEIAEGNHPFKTIVIDTLDLAYKMCADHICRKYRVDHESDLGYGKGFSLTSNEFQRVLTKLAHLPYGLFLISHSQQIEIETRTGKYTKIVPTLPEKTRKTVLGLVDIILYCDIEITAGPDNRTVMRRVLRTKPHVNYEAGDRTGRLPEVIDLDFGKFLEAFNQGVSAQSSGQQPASQDSTPEPVRNATALPEPAAETPRPKPAAAGR